MLQSFRRVVCTLLFALGPVGLCLAQEGEEAVKSYVSSYFIVGLGIALGLAAICKSAGRRKEVRRPD